MCIGNDLSDEREVKTGVPQGPILGSIFFLCYINDITNLYKNSKILPYADDTVLYKKKNLIPIDFLICMTSNKMLID